MPIEICLKAKGEGISVWEPYTSKEDKKNQHYVFCALSRDFSETWLYHF